jgi:O-acetyl-ADP-ribose deacetylase (regulator of RNase III)
VITPGFDLSADYVINTVGPKHGVDPQNQAQQLANCYYRSLQVAADNNLKSVSFPAISCGVYGYPVAEAADLAIKGLIQGLKDFPSIEKVRICFFNDPRAVDNIQETFAQALDEN